MDRIYKTKYGNWIDLSLIESIEDIGQKGIWQKGSEPYKIPEVSFIYKNKPVRYELFDLDNFRYKTKNDFANKSNEAFDDLINAWKKFTIEHPELQIFKPIQCNCDDNVSEGKFICVHGNYFDIQEGM